MMKNIPIKTVERIRFEESVSDVDVEKIVHELKNPSYEYSQKDIRTRLEHVLVGGTCPFVTPLTPIAYLAGTMSLEEINNSRLERAEKQISWNRCGGHVSAEAGARKELYNTIHHMTGNPLFVENGMDLYELAVLNVDVKYRNKKVSPNLQRVVDSLDKSGFASFAFYLGMAPIIEGTDKAGFPKLIKIASDDSKIIIEDKNFLSKFRFALPYRDDQFDTFYADIAPRVKALIDEEGYLFVRK